MASILMNYKRIDFNDFDSLYNTLTGFRNATDSVKASHPTIDCKVELVPRYKEINVKIESDQPSVLEQALGDYFNIAGKPSFVQAAHHYDLVENVLQPLGLTLKRKFTYLTSGKWVVPLPTNQ